MNFHKEAKLDRYDVVVVGAGIGGLTAAALLARTGKSVLLIERHRRPGGAAHGFTRHPWRFDSGVHLISGCGPHGYRNGCVIHRIMDALDAVPRAPFLPVDPFAQIVYPPGSSVWLQAGEEPFVAGLSDAFPGHADALTQLCRLCRDVAEELTIADDLLENLKHSSVSPTRALPNLFRYRRATVADVVRSFLPDTRLQSAYTGLWPYLGVPPSRLSFLAWAVMCAGFVYEGSYYCRGTFQAYADILAASIARSGGEVLLDSSVRRIRVEGGRAVGVMLENSQFIQSDAVISNVDMRQTAELLIGREHLPASYWEQLEQLQESASVFVTYLATDLPIATGVHAHESFFYESFDHDRTFANASRGEPDFFSITIPTLNDPSLAPPGQHIVMLTQLAPYRIERSWRDAKSGFQTALLDRAERILPGLRDHLLFIESGSPRTVERYTLNHRGAAYGWAATPEQVGAHRPAIRGPLPGLFFAGHWTRPCGGVTGVSFSGVLAAQGVLGLATQEEFWSLF